MMTSRLLELTAVVSRLHKACPWTLTQSTTDMVAHTRNELAEVEEAMAACTGAGGAEAGAPARAHLEAELGDVLFNVLMLIEAASKEHGTAGLEEVSERSILKLRRRAPYAFEGGPAVATTAEAELLWQVRSPRSRYFFMICTRSQETQPRISHVPVCFRMRPCPANVHYLERRRARPQSLELHHRSRHRSPRAPRPSPQPWLR